MLWPVEKANQCGCTLACNCLSRPVPEIHCFINRRLCCWDLKQSRNNCGLPFFYRNAQLYLTMILIYTSLFYSHNAQLYLPFFSHNAQLYLLFFCCNAQLYLLLIMPSQCPTIPAIFCRRPLLYLPYISVVMISCTCRSSIITICCTHRCSVSMLAIPGILLS